jgi:hypothetical protein
MLTGDEQGWAQWTLHALAQTTTMVGIPVKRSPPDPVHPLE